MDISFSKAGVWRRCHQKYDYKYNQRLAKKRKDRAPFLGTIIHDMLHHRALKQIAPNSNTPSPERVLEKYRKKYRVLFREEQELYGDIIGDITRIFAAYDRHYKKEPLEYLGTEDCVITELAKDIRFIGYIDKRVRDAKTEMTWAADHKSGKQIPDDEVRFSDYQLILYPWAWNRENRSKPIDGILWDYIRTKPPAIPEQLKSGELTKRKDIDTDHFTYLSEIKRLELDPADYEEILDILKAKRSNFFRRIFLPTAPKAVTNQIVNELIITAREIQHLGKVAITRSLSRNCSFDCEFYNLCQAELRGLDSDFVRKTQYEEREPSDHAEKVVSEE